MGRVSLPAMSISRIDFGAPSAERDIERGLGEYFVESEAYERVRSGAKRIVIGSRGIGKSAIFQVLAQREREAGSYVIELSPEDYSYELLSQTMTAENSGSWAKLGAYAVAWKYLLYVLIMKEISAKRAAIRKGAGNDIYKYVRDNHSSPQGSKLSALVSYLKRMEGIKLGKYEASIRTRELEKLYKLEEIHALLPSRPRRSAAAAVRRGPGGRGPVLRRARPGHRGRVPLPVPGPAHRVRRLPRQGRVHPGPRRPGVPVPGAHHAGDPDPGNGRLAGSLHP